MSEDVIAWLTERRDNCRRIAATKHGADHDGWIEDASYFQQAIDLIGDYCDSVYGKHSKASGSKATEPHQPSQTHIRGERDAREARRKHK